MVAPRQLVRYTAADPRPAQYCQMLSMVSITEGKMAPFPGGVLIRAAEAEGGCVGPWCPRVFTAFVAGARSM
eukprot:SAG25_NODE_79_length_16803_cov_43.538194_5_plen_72_part_00